MRRIVLFDQTETTDYTRYYGCGLGNEIYSLQQLETMSPDRVRELLTIGDGDGVLLVGGKPFNYLREFYHFGIRSENYFDCSKLARLSIEGGAFVKCVTEFPDQRTIQFFMSPEFSEHMNFSWFQHKVLHTFEEAIHFLDWMSCQPAETMYGFDYEASGMPLDKWFEVSGASICTIKFGGFISFTDLRHNTSPENYQQVLNKLAVFLELRQDHIWVYNMQYEFQVSHRILGITLYNLCDASTVNVLDGDHLKKYSLKWTANKVLWSTVWDTEFDRISELIDSMLFEEIGKTKKDRQKILKVTQETFKQTPEWAELCRLYPSYIQEFESLILEYWGNPFMCIPSDILGHYCNLDAFYTLMIYEQRKSEYSEDAWKVFLDNTRLGSLLHSSGLYIDEKFRMEYHNESLRMMAWGITYCAEARCMIKMRKHQKLMANIKRYNPVAQKLIRDGKFFNGDILEITKYLLSSNIDTMDVYELGLNEGALLMNYGPEFAETFVKITRESMIEAEMIKTKKKTGEVIIKKLDEGVVRKKKLLGIMADKIYTLLGLHKTKLGAKHLELEKYIYYENAYLELMKISQNQLGNIYEIPETIYAFGQNMKLDEYSDYISKNYFKCKSPIENDEICLEFAQLYPRESAFLASLLNSTQQLDGAEHFYTNRGINTIEEAFQDFLQEYEDWYNGGKVQFNYPDKVFNLATQYIKDLSCDEVKDIWSNFNGYNAQEQFFKYVTTDQINLYEQPFSEDDLGDDRRFFFMRKLVINYLLYKKYSKVLSTYIDGMFKANNIWCIENPVTHIPIRLAEPDEYGAVEKCMVHYEVNTKSSKRWSSGFHTIISHADLKDCIATPPEVNVYGERQSYIMTYFDIKY